MRVVSPPSSEWAEDFLALAEAASRVRHPLVAGVEAFGRLEDGACYIGNELVQGQALDEWADGVGIPPLPQVVDLLRRLCVGLQTAARAGVAHDALNPRNIRVVGPANDTGMRVPVKLLDLGVMAACFDEPRDVRALRFMAPEQLARRSEPQAPENDTFRCSESMNVFSCGSLLYHLSTGGPPFAGISERELLAAQSAGRVVPPQRINPQISGALNAVILRALAYDPRARFESVAQLGEALGRLDGQAQLTQTQSGSDLLELPAREGRRDSHEQRAVTPHNDQEADLLDGSPTFKAPDILALLREREERAEHETPTISPPKAAAAPAPDPHEAVSGVSPIALLTSAPPHEGKAPSRSARPRATTPAAPLQPWPDTLGEPAGAIVLVDEEPAPATTRISVPHTPVPASGRPRPRRRAATWPWLLPLAAAACVLAFMGVRALTSPIPAPVEPRARVADEGPRVPAAALREPSANDERREPSQADEAPSAPSPSEVPHTGAILRGDSSSPAPRIAAASRRERSHARATSDNASRSSASASAPSAAPAPAPAVVEHAAPELDPSAEMHIEDVVPAPAPAASAITPPPAPSPKLVEPPSPQPVPSSGPRPVSPGHALSAAVDVGSYVVRGSLPTAPVRRAVERLRGAFANCYKAAAQAAGHNAFGESIVEVRIDERGRASSPRVHGGQLPRLDACIADAVAKLVCEKAPDTGTVLASWKVTFGP